MRKDPRLLDAGLAATSALLTLLVIFDVGVAAASDPGLAGARWWAGPLMLVPSAALLLRRTRPLVTVVGVWIPVALHALITGNAGEGLFLVWPAWVSLYALAAYGDRRQLRVGLVVALVALAVHDYNDPAAWRAGAEAAWSAAWWDLLLFVPALVGGVVAGSRRARTLAVEKALLEAQAREAVAHERARIARELHDVVTHHVNLVVLQAMAASGVLDRDPERVREPLAVIERSGRDALAELRRLLGVLHEDVVGNPIGAPLSPQPGVDDLGTLVDAARAGGLEVGLVVTGTPRGLTTGLALTVYRIVQESLTNAARHAVGAHVGVSVRYEPAAIDVAVVDDGPCDPASDHGGSDSGGGRGLQGMRERVALFAGTLEAGPVPDGGFAVHARLPTGVSTQALTMPGR